MSVRRIVTVVEEIHARAAGSSPVPRGSPSSLR